jgi:hypothetical protein
MKKISLLLFSGLFLLEGFSQPRVIKSKLSKIFFGINLPTTRFDVREKLNSNNNLFGYEEYNYSNTDYDDLQAYFTSNPILSYTQNAMKKSISVPFKKDNDKSEIMQMYFYYQLSDIIFSRKQLDEIIKIFTPISYKIIKDNKYENDDRNGKKIGEVYFIYSSVNSYKKNENFIIIFFEYRKIENIIEKNHTYELPNGEYCFLDITVFSDRIY